MSVSVMRMFVRHPDVWFRIAELQQKFIKTGVPISKKAVGRYLDEMVYRYKFLETAEGADLLEIGIKTAHSQARYYKLRPKPSQNRDTEKLP